MKNKPPPREISFQVTLTVEKIMFESGNESRNIMIIISTGAIVCVTGWQRAPLGMTIILKLSAGMPFHEPSFSERRKFEPMTRALARNGPDSRED